MYQHPHVSDRPTAVLQLSKVLATKQPFAACGRLTLLIGESNGSARSARVPLQIFGAFNRRFCRFSIILGPMCLTACSAFWYGHHTSVGHVAAFPKDDADTIEIRMLYKVNCRGKAHNPFSYGKSEYLTSD